jgi:hypothetical protein
MKEDEIITLNKEKKEELKNQKILIGETPLQNSEIKFQNINSTNEYFLFIFKPQTVDIEFCCGYSLFSTIRIISIILIILGIIDVLMTYLNTNFFNFLEAFIYSVLYLISGIYLFVSTITFKSNDALIGYKLYEFLFLFELTIFILKIILICIGIIHPLGEGSYFVRKFTLYLIFGISQEIIKLYLLWITFSYLINLKLNRIKVIIPNK